MKKERKNNMKKMIAEFIISEYDNPRLKAIRDTDEKAFDKVVQKMRDGEALASQNHKRRCRQSRENFEKNFLKDFHYTVKGPNITLDESLKYEPTDHYKVTSDARKAAIIGSMCNRTMKPTERESQLSALARDINRVNVSTDVSSGTMYSKALGIYDITKQVLEGIKMIKDNFNDGYERCAFSSALGLLSFVCTEYGKLANDIFNTGIREKWALDELGPLNDTLCKKWDGVIKAPLEDDRQDEKVESDDAKVDDLLPGGKGWKTRTIRLFISQPFTGKTEEEIFKQREEVVATVQEVYKGATTIEVIDQYHQECDVDRRLHHLAESIKLMDSADLVYFTKDWKDAPGCRIEHAIAVEYGFHILIEDSKRIY